MKETDMAPQSDAPLTASRDAEAEAAGRDGEDAIVGRTVTIDRPRGEIYAFWRDFSNLPRVMENVERIVGERLRRGRSRRRQRGL